jgi:DNA-binding GntR family transcriptional regulator
MMQNQSHGAGEVCELLLSDRAYELICGAILSGDIVAGSRLKMETLQRQYTLSSSPLREALNRLAAEGLVGLSYHCGFRAAEVSADDLRDIADFRLKEHRALMDAALARDAALAVELLREHITRTSEHVRRALSCGRG